ncbi:hypothetical protein IWZ00DRAFT_46703 [Phyllosticta capitalensis]
MLGYSIIGSISHPPRDPGDVDRIPNVSFSPSFLLSSPFPAFRPSLSAILLYSCFSLVLSVHHIGVVGRHRHSGIFFLFFSHHFSIRPSPPPLLPLSFPLTPFPSRCIIDCIPSLAFSSLLSTSCPPHMWCGPLFHIYIHHPPAFCAASSVLLRWERPRQQQQQQQQQCLDECTMGHGWLGALARLSAWGQHVVGVGVLSRIFFFFFQKRETWWLEARICGVGRGMASWSVGCLDAWTDGRSQANPSLPTYTASRPRSVCLYEPPQAEGRKGGRLDAVHVLVGARAASIWHLALGSSKQTSKWSKQGRLVGLCG